jgi:hypothetical protein
MNIDWEGRVEMKQAESSTAQSRKAAFHLATFVFDSGSLPLESYIKLIEHGWDASP